MENDPSTCPRRVPAAVAQEGERTQLKWVPPNPGEAVLPTPAPARNFPSSTTLGAGAIAELMARRYVTVVGILGDPESGKTAALASLYLLVAHAKLQGWSFADSRSLMGFEDIARGSRQWNMGVPPEQMTVHTHLSDDRNPGFLHLRLRREVDGRCIDLALPDLPGEWTQALVRSSKWDRLNFLKAADAIWIFADGRSLSDKQKRQSQILRLGQLAGRLKASMPEGVPRLILVVTHRDTVEVPATTMDQISNEFAKDGLKVQSIAIASFVKRGQGINGIKPGHGLGNLIDLTTASPEERTPFWPASTPSHVQRSYLAYRRAR
jgi:hypothetical protein